MICWVSAGKKRRRLGSASPQWPSPRRPLLHAADSARVVQTGSQGSLEDNHGRKNESGCPKAAVEGRARATSEAENVLGRELSPTGDRQRSAAMHKDPGYARQSGCWALL